MQVNGTLGEIPPPKRGLFRQPPRGSKWTRDSMGGGTRTHGLTGGGGVREGTAHPATVTLARGQGEKRRRKLYRGRTIRWGQEKGRPATRIGPRRMPTGRRRQQLQKPVKTSDAMGGSAPMTKSLEVCLQLLHSLLTAPHQGPRVLQPADHTEQGGGHTGRPHGHAHLQSHCGSPFRATETRIPVAHESLVHIPLISNRQRKGRKAPDESARGDRTLAEVLPRAGEITIRPPGTGQRRGSQTRHHGHHNKA